MKAKNNNDLLVKGFIYLLFACVLIISCKRHVNINDNYGLNNNRIKFIGFDSIVFKIDGYHLTGILPTHVFVAKNGIHIQAFSNDDIMKFKIINVVI